ncbi:MAG: hypothetical protein ACE5JX_19425 [Acidobacteriota bacterium]
MASTGAYWLQQHGIWILKLGFLDAVVLSLVLYPTLRLTLLKAGRFSGAPVPFSLALRESAEGEAERT